MQVQTINLSLPKKLLNVVDNRAKQEARTRSGWIQEAIRVYLENKQDWGSLFAYGEKKAKDLKVKERNLESIVDEIRRG